MNTFSPNTVASSTEVNDNFTGLSNGSEILDDAINSRHIDWQDIRWITDMLPTVSSVTNNGNRSYDVVFASTVASYLTPGMRLRLTRTVAPPTQCTDLESGSSQYFSAASAGLAGVTFTDDYTCMAWIKLESYGAECDIISRYDGTNGWMFRIKSDGTLSIWGKNSASTADECVSYQSVPLNKWVHVAASLDLSGTSGVTYMDGVVVPSAYTNGTSTSITQAGNLEVGARNASAFFDGKLAQVAVFSAVLSATTIRSYASQTLSGSETNLVSAYSCNNSLLDLNTTNNNDLTANGGALMTNTDSPFGTDGNGTSGGTYEFGIVTKVSTTTATVQVPEGCAIPTSGGISAVDYSSDKAPYGFPVEKNSWTIISLLNYNYTNISFGGTATWTSSNFTITAPVGKWTLKNNGVYNLNSTVSGVRYGQIALAYSGELTNGVYSSNPLIRTMYLPTGADCVNSIFAEKSVNITSPTEYIVYASIVSSTGSETWRIRGDNGMCVLSAELEYLL